MSFLRAADAARADQAGLRRMNRRIKMNAALAVIIILVDGGTYHLLW